MIKTLLVLMLLGVGVQAGEPRGFLWHKCRDFKAEIAREGNKLIVRFRDDKDERFIDAIIYPVKEWSPLDRATTKSVYYYAPDKELSAKDFGSSHEPVAVYKHGGKKDILVYTDHGIELWNESDFDYWKKVAKPRVQQVEFVEHDK